MDRRSGSVWLKRLNRDRDDCTHFKRQLSPSDRLPLDSFDARFQGSYSIRGIVRVPQNNIASTYTQSRYSALRLESSGGSHGKAINTRTVYRRVKGSLQRGDSIGQSASETC